MRKPQPTLARAHLVLKNVLLAKNITYLICIEATIPQQKVFFTSDFEHNNIIVVLKTTMTIEEYKRKYISPGPPCKGICVTFMLRVFGCERYGVGNQVIRLATNI
uniref:MSP domain-containing protein n=1 Tax=Heterorhabditis bacteriophora TaxID=37862 RepID=A0A1I7WJH5_HETBA